MLRRKESFLLNSVAQDNRHWQRYWVSFGKMLFTRRATVYICARKTDGGAIKELIATALPIELDVSYTDSCTHAATEIGKTTKTLDILINNVAMETTQPKNDSGQINCTKE